MFNVQAIKNRQEVSLVYCTNQTKRFMEKTKKKTIEQSGVRKGSPMERVESIWREGFKEKVKNNNRNDNSNSNQSLLAVYTAFVCVDLFGFLFFLSLYVLPSATRHNYTDQNNSSQR